MKVAITKNSWLKDSDLRLDASFHLSQSIQIKHLFQKSPYVLSTIGNQSEKIFSGNIFKRVYVKNPHNGIPYITGSDMIKQDIDSGKYISKKQAHFLQNLILKKDWILVSCSGTLGNTVFTNELFQNKIATHDLIRILPNSKDVLNGFLYAYLSSKYGYSLLTQSSYGGVVKHIEPEHIENIPVPIFPENKQLEIHNLIVESAELRVEANKALAVAHNQINDILAINDLQSKNIGYKSLKTILKSHNCRFEANYFQSKGYDLREKIIENYNFKTLGEITSDIFRPGIFKRTYVEKGTTFLGGSDITKAIPDSEKKLSKMKTQGLSDLMLKKHWILITCGGTIGNMAYVDSELEKCAASQHILRIVSSKVLSGYLFAFLSSNIGKEIIQSYTYGSVIPQIEPHHISGIPIPIFNQETEQGIHELVMQYVEKIENSKIKELQAIQLVENEIEQWQH